MIRPHRSTIGGVKCLGLGVTVASLAVGVIVGLSVVAGLFALLILLRIIVWIVAVPVYGAFRYFAPILPSKSKPDS